MDRTSSHSFRSMESTSFQINKRRNYKAIIPFHSKTVLFLFFDFYRLSSNSNSHRRSRSRQASSSTKKQDRQSVGRNQVFTDTAVDSFFISSANITQSAIGTSPWGIEKTLEERFHCISSFLFICLEGQKPTSSSAKRYVSSFKTLVNSTSGKHNQRISYANDSVIIVKLSKESKEMKYDY